MCVYIEYSFPMYPALKFDPQNIGFCLRRNLNRRLTCTRYFICRKSHVLTCTMSHCDTFLQKLWQTPRQLCRLINWHSHTSWLTIEHFAIVCSDICRSKSVLCRNPAYFKVFFFDQTYAWTLETGLSSTCVNT